MQWLSTWSIWHWLILGFILLIGEIIIPGIFLLWWGLAALTLAAVVFLFPQLGLPTAFILYAILAIALSLIWWKIQHNKDRQDQSQTHLNQRDHLMLNKIGIVQSIQANGIGRGHFGDTTWRIKGQHLQQGDSIKVIKVEGITLFVQKIEEQQ
ncbi:NfeD family protein [Volucribacter amazonae]|uniref:NfeD-like C-terminal domain-containing protein n=1 Tax=Volucribacter amazonae TaxID=256731 RepID=A0A9X4SLL5_9PAST|nr:NfeD family protein [Volucribacter amazonae]MDG6896294.1 hypothetical protein [Volucribacter amazonae]